MHSSKKVLIGVLAVAGVAGTAWAQTPEKKPAPAAGEAKPGAAPGAEMMKPPAELQQYKAMIGTWKCDGQNSMAGKSIKTTGTYKAAWDLDGHVVEGDVVTEALVDVPCAHPHGRRLPSSRSPADGWRPIAALDAGVTSPRPINDRPSVGRCS